MQDKPTDFPTTQPTGEQLKPITEILLDRRATMHFTSDPVPDEVLDAILRFGAQAPSGYNLQPWRFIVVRKKKNLERLQEAAFNQPKVTEAPVVIIAFGSMPEVKETAEEIFRAGAERGAGNPDAVPETMKKALDFLETFDPAVWINRHTMIAVTTMMLVAEAYGFDTAPMEGFDARAVRREFGIPASADVVALLAIGRLGGEEKAYPGRFALDRIVYEERYGEPWTPLSDR